MSSPRDGIAASTLHLPAGSWVTVLDCLCAHFPAISRAQWLDRIDRGRVLLPGDEPATSRTPYRAGLPVRYFREVVDEPVIPFTEAVLHVDEHLVVADKPHFLPVTPAGAYVEQTLLHRLASRLGRPELVPLHRIDRLTAGLVLFSAQPATRAAYQALFRERRIEKTYEALAPPMPGRRFPWVQRSRLVPGEPFFRMAEAAGEANSETRVEVLDRDAATWRYRLQPITGRKHQLRVHMAALGAAILGDPLYPELQPPAPDDHRHPLQLLARELRFVDPLTGDERVFESTRQLAWPESTD